MKRGLFFWLEKLKIAPGERKAISGLLILLVLLGGLNLALSPSVPFGDGDYVELEQQFAERTAMLKAEEEKLMEQYYPASAKGITKAKVDTVTKDTADTTEADQSEQRVKNPGQKAEKERINVNKASVEVLEQLPG
ncbi:MAG: hypothetical protein GWO38_23675, partial [Phycisphaerae bacterium]|nr:hypothetical protein [Phycisphaerae bacterium]NIX00909.1 hypothetical protein [Phycisphaerae bacterium]NIX30553.1 hypothetical protein [Phycisphaerae bacterium]